MPDLEGPSWTSLEGEMLSSSASYEWVPYDRSALDAFSTGSPYPFSLPAPAPIPPPPAPPSQQLSSAMSPVGTLGYSPAATVYPTDYQALSLPHPNITEQKTQGRLPPSATGSLTLILHPRGANDLFPDSFHTRSLGENGTLL